MKNRKTAENSDYRIAIIGHRGIPNSYGGFETLAEELSSCLVNLGAKTTVYCRTNYFENKPSTFHGAKLVYLPSIPKKSLETIVHTFVSVLHIFIKNTADTVIVVNVGNAPAALLAKLLGKKVIFCVDGLDWQRKKWGKVAKAYLRMCSYFAGIVSHEVVTDAASVFEFYQKERKIKSTLIPYGTDIETDLEPSAEVLSKYNLESKKYFVYAARFEPENNPIFVVKSYVKSGSHLPLVMIGDNRYNPEYVAKIKEVAKNSNVIFTGYLFGSQYKQLVKNSLASVRAAEVGGLSPVVIEAMGRSVCMIANDKPENREPLAEAGLYFALNDKDQLAEIFRNITKNPEKAIEIGKKAAQRAMVLYSWDKIGYEYFKLVKKLANQPVPGLAFGAPAESGKKKKILITGAGGGLGNALHKHFEARYEILATTLNVVEKWQTELDVTRASEVENVISSFRPDYIFHLAAMTDLEACEKNLTEAYAVNTLSTKTLAQLSVRYGAKFIYVSTGNVFNGTKNIYSETEEPLPLNVYGLTKRMGELMAEYYAPRHLTLRLGWLIGGGPLVDKKFVPKIVEQIVAGRKELHAVNDRFGTISYAPDVAVTLEELMNRDAVGIYHVASSTEVSRYDIAKKIVEVLGYDSFVKVLPVNSNYFSSVYSTLRPEHECLSADRMKMERIFTIRPWDKAISDYLFEDFAYAVNTIERAAKAHQKPSLA